MIGLHISIQSVFITTEIYTIYPIQNKNHFDITTEILFKVSLNIPTILSFTVPFYTSIFFLPIITLNVTHLSFEFTSIFCVCVNNFFLNTKITIFTKKKTVRNLYRQILDILKQQCNKLHRHILS